jgi:hypothetical protein
VQGVAPAAAAYTVGIRLPPLLLLLLLLLLAPMMMVANIVELMGPTLGASEELVLAARDFLARLVLILAKEGMGTGGGSP